MPKNKLISRPAEPDTAVRETSKRPAYIINGWTSLVLAVVLFLMLAFTLLALEFASDGPTILGTLIYASLFLLVLWICAVVLAIKGRRSVPGKVGIGLSLVNLALYVYLLFQYQNLRF